MTLRKLIALLLACLMLAGLMAGCSSESPAEPTTPGSADSEGTPAADEQPELADTTTETTSEAGYDLGGLTLPLADELTTLTAFRSYTSTYLTNPNEKGCYQVLEDRTNVHIDWNTYSETDQFYLYIVSQEYTDLLYMESLSLYTGGFDKGIEDEVLVAGNDYLSIMPNFSRYLQSSEDIDKQCKTDSGNYFFNNVQSGEQPAWIGPMMRTDWVADVGMELPVTYDDWYNILTAWKNDLGISKAMLLSQTGYSTLGYGLTPGFDTIGDFYAENGTTVKYGILDSGFKEYVEMMAKWYAENLIHPDFISTAWYSASDYYVKDEMGAFDDQSYTFRSILPMMNPDEDDDLVAVPFPSKTAADQGSLHFRRVNEICGTTPIFITVEAVANGVDELCARWIDYHYSEDGAFVLNYGVEGETWELGEDGLPHFNEFFLNNPEGKMVTEMTDRYADGGYGSYYMWIREYDQYTEDILSAYTTWGDSSTGDWVMPPITMTAEEGEDYNEIFSNVQTYVNEMVLRIITGALPVSEWDNVVAEVEAMGIQECIDIKQAALDRYNAR